MTRVDGHDIYGHDVMIGGGMVTEDRVQRQVTAVHVQGEQKEKWIRVKMLRMTETILVNFYVKKMVTICFCFFFFNDTATTEIYTLSLHDALPIFGATILMKH